MQFLGGLIVFSIVVTVLMALAGALWGVFLKLLRTPARVAAYRAQQRQQAEQRVLHEVNRVGHEAQEVRSGAVSCAC